MPKIYTPINWEDGTIVKQATVKINDIEYDVTPAEVEGSTPVTAENLKHMDDAILYLYEEGATSKDIYIGDEESAPEDAKIVIDPDEVPTGGIVQRNVITAGFNTYTTTTADVEKMTMKGTPIYKNGDKLTIKDGSIVVGSGVNAVLISGNLKFSVVSVNSVHSFNVYLNDDIVASSSLKLTDNWTGVSIGGVIIPVKEGDVISGYVKSATAGAVVHNNNSNTNITVEVIA